MTAAALLGVSTASAAPKKRLPVRKPAPVKKTTPGKQAGNAKKNTLPSQASNPDSPIAGNEKFPGFVEILDKLVADNSTDYCNAVRYVLEATDGDETAVSAWMQEVAKAGNLAASRWVVGQKLADIPHDKLQSPEIKEAYQTLTKIGAQGYVPALLDESACLRMGIGVAKNDQAALAKVTEAAKNGHMLARFQLLLAGKKLASFADKDKPEVAAEVERGNHYVIYRLSGLAPDAATQLDWMQKAAEKGSGEAYFALSSLASAKQPKESYKLLLKAVELNHVEALFVLASALLEENPSNPFVREAAITPDPAKGLMLLKTAALLGNVQAGMALGNAYFDGALGLPKDEAKALFHFSNPQIASSAASATARGLMYLRGFGTQQDTAKGLDLLQRASRVGYPQATILLAYAHYKGLGVPENARTAADLLSEAAAARTPIAYVYLAFITAKGGAGLPADVPQAKRYIRLAAMDMGDRAQQLYDTLIAGGEWNPHP